MIRQDYIIRLIEQFGQVWATVVGQIHSQLFPSARATLDQAYQQILGLTSDNVRSFSSGDLLARMYVGTSEEHGRERSIILGALLSAEGDLVTKQNDPDLASWYYQKALDILLTTALKFPDQPLPDNIPSIEQIADTLADYHLPINTNRLLFGYYESHGAFAKAEDCLFDMLTHTTQPQPIVALGEDFYQRLQLRTDNDLATGNFSHQEIAAGLAELQRMSQELS